MSAGKGRAYRDIVSGASVDRGTGEHRRRDTSGRLPGSAPLTRPSQAALGQSARLLVVQHVPQAV